MYKNNVEFIVFTSNIRDSESPLSPMMGALNWSQRQHECELMERRGTYLHPEAYGQTKAQKNMDGGQ